MKIPQILYHYCTTDNFKKIVEEKYIRLSDLMKSNDSMERDYIYNVFRQVENSIKRIESKDQLDAQTDLLSPENRLLQAYKSSFEKKNTENQFGILYEKLVECKELVCRQSIDLGICLSQEGDLLSQWRAYANNGNGVAIGFNSKLFEPYNSTINYENRKIRFGKVEYDQKSQVNFMLDKWVESLKSEESKINIMFDLIYDALYFKHSSFCEEKEWRLTFSEDSKQENMKISLPIQNDCILMPVQYFAKADMLIPYRDLNFNEFNEPICEIILGPKNKNSVSDITAFLEHNNLKGITVKKSKAPYR